VRSFRTGIPLGVFAQLRGDAEQRREALGRDINITLDRSFLSRKSPSENAEWLVKVISR
jgi:hypothetical protein